MELVVWQHGAHPHEGVARMGKRVMRCALGLNGIVREGREGDGATPAGIYPLRRVLYRPDRGPAPATRLPRAPIGLRDGWCDAPDDPAYNRPVRLPWPASAETLRRRDRLYDTICVLGHNDDPPVPGLGSAIFLHVAREGPGPGLRPTLGCIALAPDDLACVLAAADTSSRIRILPPRHTKAGARP